MPDIAITQVDPETGVSVLSLSRSPKILTGIDLLAQVVTLEFLKNPGRDVIDPDEGSGVRSAIGQYNLSDPGELRLLILQRTKSVEKRIIGRQTGGVVDPSERLKKLTLLGIGTDEVAGKVLASVRLTNETGDQADLLI